MAEIVGFIVVVGMGLLMCAAPVLDIPYENMALTISGVITLSFCAWAVVDEIKRKYKVVRR